MSRIAELKEKIQAIEDANENLKEIKRMAQILSEAREMKITVCTGCSGGGGTIVKYSVDSEEGLHLVSMCKKDVDRAMHLAEQDLIKWTESIMGLEYESGPK